MTSANNPFTPLERRILDSIQQAFPLAPNPYDVLAGLVEATREEVLSVVRALRDSGIIRRIGGSFVPGPLGHMSALVAARVDPDAIDAAAGRASVHPEVTHNYERCGVYNLWFTVIAPARARLEEVLDDVRCGNGVRALYELPARRTFKIRVNFDFGAGSAATAPAHEPPTPPAEPLSIDTTDKRLIARTCGDIGPSDRPFAALAAEIGVTEGQVIRRLNRFRGAGALRRFGAVLRHQKAGMTANGMSVWDVPADQVTEAGRLMAGHPEVSHCYERPRMPDWPYNMYAMIHGRIEADCLAVARQMADEIGTAEADLLFSQREFKKTSMVYFAQQQGG